MLGDVIMDVLAKAGLAVVFEHIPWDKIHIAGSSILVIVLLGLLFLPHQPRMRAWALTYLNHQKDLDDQKAQLNANHQQEVAQLKDGHQKQLADESHGHQQKLDATKGELASVRKDIDGLTERLHRQNVMLSLFVRLDNQILALARATTASDRARQYHNLLNALAIGVGDVMPRDPGDHRHCLILLPSKVNGEHKLRVKAHNNQTDPADASKISFGFGEGIAGKVFAEGAPYYAPDVDKDPVYKKGKPSLSDRYHSLVVCPIKAPTGDLLGVISLDNTRPDAYSGDDIDRMMWIAKKAGVIIYLMKQLSTPSTPAKPGKASTTPKKKERSLKL